MPTSFDRISRAVRRAGRDPEAFSAAGSRLAAWGMALARVSAVQLRRDAAPQMAAALAFRTLFGLLPVFVLATILVRALGGFDQFREMLSGFLGSLGLDDLTVQPMGATEQLESVPLSEWLMQLLSEVENLNLAAITWVGVGVLAYSAVGLMSTIEGSFNRILGASEGRPWSRRIPVYWTVVTVAPALLAIARYVDARFDAIVQGMVSWGWLLSTISTLWSLSVTWLVVYVVYRIVPTAAVRARPALLGALTTALLFEIGKGTLDLYLRNALSVRQLYGSLGLLPLFMFWVYLMWLVVLFGLEVTAILQAMPGRRLELRESGASAGPRIGDASHAVGILRVACDRFARGETTTVEDLAEAMALAPSGASRFVDELVTRGLLRRLASPEDALVPGRPPDRITEAEALEAGFALAPVPADAAASSVVQRLRAAQRAAAADRMIASPVADP